MTELSFLIDLLLNHKLPKVTKDAIADRIKSVESMAPAAHPRPVHPFPNSVVPVPMPPVPAEAIAQTAATAAALASRQTAINVALSGKPEAGRTSPRKF